MGTAISVHLADDLPVDELSRLADEVFDWLCEVDRRFSTYRDDSEINRLNRGDIGMSECSAEVRFVLDTCADLWRSTDGSFDAYATGRLDPSGFVKGWSVQVASDRLVAAGCVNHCLNAGGDIRLRGEPAPGEPWRVGIRHPTEPDKLCDTVAGTDLAVATSGSYERGSHVIDPHRGTPATHLHCVTVIGRDLGLCDAYATAALAKGRPGITWLTRLPDHDFLAVTETGEYLRSARQHHAAG